MTVSATSTPIPWFGGKSLLARRIAAMLPPHRVYVEVFGGSGAVLFAKRPSHLEVWNDLDDGLVNFFRMLRDQPEELARLVQLTPFARREYELCRSSWVDCADPVEKARRWYVTLSQAFNATPPGTNFSGWRGEFQGMSHTTAPNDIANDAERMLAFAQRFKRVQIEQADWRVVLDRYDGPDACFYLDPPYVASTRKSGGYNHELADADHAELIARLTGIEAPTIIVSGYDHPLYRQLEVAGFVRHEFAATTRAALPVMNKRAGKSRNTDASRIECIWRRAREDLSLF